jgi:transposase-like protein
MCTDKPLVLVDRGPWYRWAFERLGLEYRHERLGIRNRIERFFRYLKERTAVFHHELRERPRTGNKQPKTIPKPIHNILSNHKNRR